MLRCFVLNLYCTISYNIQQGHALIVGFGTAPWGEVAMIVTLIGLEAGVIDQGVYVVLVLMSLLTTIITPIVYRNWFFRGEYLTYNAEGICIDEGK